MHKPWSIITAALMALIALTACGSDDDTPSPGTPNIRPSFVGSVTTTAYAGADDLLTAGLGWDGLQSATPPTLSAPPTAAELRRLAIYSNYRALVDMTTAGGYGRLFGPNVAPSGAVDSTPGAGKVFGTEYLAYIVGSNNRAEATVMVQVPDSFNVNVPCIVTATSSGSRGVYGAISAAGEWALKRGCAVAYTDKGTGNGAHELMTDTITLINGQPANAAAAGDASQFTAQISAPDLNAFNLATPFRYAYKHAHSQVNPEKDWGRFTLQAVQFAFWAINERFASSILGSNVKKIEFTPSNTTVIADSVSNGGGAAIAAAEQDTGGLIDGVVVGEPQVNLRLPVGVNVQRGNTLYPATAIGHTLYDYTSLANLLQPCAAYATAAAGSPLISLVPQAGAQARCAALSATGFIQGADFVTQANDALATLRAAGWEPESDLLHASHWGFQATPGVTVSYANAYSRSSVRDNLCGFSFATLSATGIPTAPLVSPMLIVFGVGNGVPPTAGINIVYNPAIGGPIVHTLANGDFAFLGAQCLRQLWTTQNTTAVAVQQGVSEVRLTGNLRGKPTIILHGRSDALVPVNNTSRPYFGVNKAVEGVASRLTYIEVLNAQHFDTFLGLAGYAERFVPMHYYTQQALDLMWNHLRVGTSLPPSQVIRTTPRGTGAPALTVANLPAIAAAPATGDQITFDAPSLTVRVPD